MAGSWLLIQTLRYENVCAGKAIEFWLFTENDVETVCLLSRLSEAKNHISVKVDKDEVDLTAAERKVT